LSPTERCRTMKVRMAASLVLLAVLTTLAAHGAFEPWYLPRQEHQRAARALRNLDLQLVVTAACPL